LLYKNGQPCYVIKQIYMKTLSALFLTCLMLSAQVAAPQEPSRFQEITNPNDERLKVFNELEAKAEAGNPGAIAELGNYYYHGQFPLIKDIEKAKQAWTMGASLGSFRCAASMEDLGFPRESSDSEIVIEKTKWFIISNALSDMNRQSEVRLPTKRYGVSESSFAEAKIRAEVFLSTVRISKPVKTTALGDGNGATPGQNASGIKRNSYSLRFESLSLFDTHRRNVCSAYLKAANAIYNKGEIASEDEKSAFVAAALELERLQAYVGKSRRLGLDYQKSNAGLQSVNMEKMNDLYAKMASARIVTRLPASRAELNEASIYINALGQLMQLPIRLGN
jgi:TPR repeat protein